jgi:hypothetical protein
LSGPRPSSEAETLSEVWSLRDVLLYRLRGVVVAG